MVRKGCIPWNKGRHLSAEHRLHIGQAHIGKIGAMRGRKFSVFHRQNISAALKSFHSSHPDSCKGRKHLPETRVLMSQKMKEGFASGRLKPRKGFKLSDEHKAKLSKALMGRPVLWGRKSGNTLRRKYESGELKSWNKGKPMSEATRKKLSDGYWGWSDGDANPMKNPLFKYKCLMNNSMKLHATCMKISLALISKYAVTPHPRKGVKFTDMHKHNLSDALRLHYLLNQSKLKGTHFDASHCEGISNSLQEFYKSHEHHMKGKQLSTARRKLMSASMQRRWKNPQDRDKMVLASRKALKCRPNKFEMCIMNFLEKNFPSVWKYCGDGSVILNGKCPDFININGKKQVILANGIHWHSEIRNASLTRIEIESLESIPYHELGYGVLFIWEDDFKNDKEGLLRSMT